MLYFNRNNNDAYFCRDRQPDTYEVGRVNWRGTNHTVILLSSVPFQTNKQPKPTNSLFCILKSNLQKQIRQKDIHAVATCEMMLDMNDFETLRRLIIIAAEDVEISKETAVISWLMASTSKCYLLSKSDKEYVLIYVNNLVQYNVCRRLEIQNSESGSNDNNYETNLDKILMSENPDKNYIAAIFFRTSYGGLSGDIPMLNKMCAYALINGLRSFKNKILITTDLKINDAAVDFHVYSRLCNEISQDTKVDPDLIKKAIWNHSSKTNARYLEDQDYGNNNEIWLKIKRSFDIRSKTYLQKTLQKYF